MATSYLMPNELNNLDNEIFHCTDQFKVWKKKSAISIIYTNKLLKSITKEISKKDFLANIASR